MNERIREIWENNDSISVVWPETGSPVSVSAKTLEKFAELILIEVTDILSTYRGKVMFTDGAEYNYEHPIIAIRKHFGVEECAK